MPAVTIPLPMTTLGNLFQDPKDVVDPKKLEEFMAMLAEVETEESDSGGPILGKLSLAKRTHNALSKADIRREHDTMGFDGNSHGQFQSMSSVWAPPGLDVSTGFHFDEAVAEEVLTIEQEAEVETEDGNGGQDSEDLPTTDEVHATMKQFHLRKCQPSQDEAARRAKSARVRRRNKVSPEQSEEEERRQQRGRTAHGRKTSSPPDPLEPWSTRELQDINKILARK
ncbi:GL26755 [Drosophila persimilis]|uniref:GL26755 n=1 Tax=Drosophila persimilis TaxID=7234 RepID=B4H2P1_DROPE|nr:GL26755 [Drosophila persimilis]